MFNNQGEKEPVFVATANSHGVNCVAVADCGVNNGLSLAGASRVWLTTAGRPGRARASTALTGSASLHESWATLGWVPAAWGEGGRLLPALVATPSTPNYLLDPVPGSGRLHPGRPVPLLPVS